MGDRKFKVVLSSVFLSACLFFGIGIGLLIRSSRLQALSQSSNERNLSGKDVSITKDISITNDTKDDNVPSRDESIVIQAVGDIIPGTNFPDNRLPRDKNKLLPDSIRSYLRRADILFGNFESSLTDYRYSAKDVSRNQVFAFRSPPSYAKLFADVGFDIFNVANNHSLDFGKVGLRDTVRNLKSVGIETVGHKNQILFSKKGNLTIATIGFAPYSFYNSIHDLGKAKALVEKAKKKAGVVIVSMHAGAEGTGALRVQNKTEYFYGENRGNSIKFARSMVDSGADLVIGHGPHVPRALDIYQGKLIAYSLGNFLGYKTLSTKAQTAYSMILEVEMGQQGKLLAAKIIPVHLDSRGIPQIDQYFRTVGLLRYLIAKDFPDTPVKINKRGEVVIVDRKVSLGRHR